MSRYICFSQNGRFDVSFEELLSKVQNPGGFFRKKRFFRVHFWVFFLQRSHFCTNLREILAPGLKWILPATLFLKKIILINPSCVNDLPLLAQKQQKNGYFDKADFWGLKYPLEVRVLHETCSTICRTPVPAILNPKNSTRSAGGAKNSQNWVFLKVQI